MSTQIPTKKPTQPPIAPLPSLSAPSLSLRALAKATIPLKPASPKPAKKPKTDKQPPKPSKQDVGTGESVSNDPYKAKKEREKMDGRKRKVERERRRRRFEEMRGRKWGEWRVEEVRGMLEGLEV